MQYIYQMDHWLQSIFHNHVWIVEIFLIVFVTLLLHTLEVIIFRRLIKKLEKTPNYWDDIFVKSLFKPLGFLIWVIGFSIAAEITSGYTKASYLVSIVPSLRKLAILVLVIWFLVRFIRMLEEALLTPRPGKKTLDKTTVHAISQIMVISVVVTGSLIGMQMYDIPISGVLAFGGIGGAAVAFAAKDLLGNFFGGLMIYLDRPFNVGDRIRVVERNIDGVVEQIGWRLTRLRGLDKRPLYIPNGVFSTVVVENPSRMTNRRIKTMIGVRYEDASKLEEILNKVEAMLHQHPDVDTTLSIVARFCEFGDSSLNFLLMVFTKTLGWVEFTKTQQDIFLKVLEIIEQHGAECAFPTRTVYMTESNS